MKKVKYLIFYLSFCIPNFSYCDELASSLNKNAFNVTVYPMSSVDVIYSSLAYGSGGSLGYRVINNADIYVQYYRTCGAVFKSNSFCIKSNSLGITNFISESFYLQIFLSNQKIDQKNSNEGSINADLNSVGFSFGSYLTKGNFSIGIDWVNVTKPISGKTTFEEIDGPLNDKKIKDQEESKNMVLSEFQLSFLKVFLTFHF